MRGVACALSLSLGTGVLVGQTTGTNIGTATGALAVQQSASTQISESAPDQAHDEVLVVAHPEDSQRIVACSMIDVWMPSWGVRVYVSRDNGTSWQPSAALPAVGLRGGASDPSCLYTALGGMLYAANEIVGPEESDERSTGSLGRLRIFRSVDDGRTWNSSSLPDGTNRHDGRRNLDRPYLAADWFDSQFTGRVYVFGQVFGDATDGSFLPFGLALWRSLDDGRTFERPVVRYPGDRGVSYWPSNPVVLTDGSVVAIVGVQVGNRIAEDRRSTESPPISNGSIQAIRSLDGGGSLEPLSRVSDAFFEVRPSRPRDLLPSLAADTSRSRYRDRLYAAWSDNRNGELEILVSYSPDKGSTWSPPRRLAHTGVRPSAPGWRLAFRPAVAVNKDGVVAVSWYEAQGAVNRFSYRVHIAASFDGGDSFEPGTNVTSSSHTVGVGERWRPYDRLARLFRTPEPSPFGVTLNVARAEWLEGGDTAGLTADALGAFHPAWVDNRTGVSQLWTAKLSVKPPPAWLERTLKAFADVTDRCVIETGALTYSQKDNVLVLNLRIRNVSSENLRTPMNLRITQLTSPIATPRLLEGSHRNADMGPLVEFSTSSLNNTLPPRGATLFASVSVKFDAIVATPFLSGGRFSPDWLHLEGRVYAPR